MAFLCICLIPDIRLCLSYICINSNFIRKYDVDMKNKIFQHIVFHLSLLHMPPSCPVKQTRSIIASSVCEISCICLGELQRCKHMPMAAWVLQSAHVAERGPALGLPRRCICILSKLPATYVLSSLLHSNQNGVQRSVSTNMLE